MTRREAVETFAVIDPNGTRLQARRVTVYETGRLIGGGEMPTSTSTELANGMTLTATIEDDKFLDLNTGTTYKRG
ncbi:hypothetical protein EKL30_16980 [Candidimonas sp. SYP-B2681]|uniref:hypothetical protein n=1 Tax=Candidimonas sp. SYP-B2681 TaxID=2497686 RepID=UPI000F870F20|nr:hypothetical protein [Candidimonas sp. SYP-B2681]RTZ39952.1 hypothetical protein EKL30_16980 [Candidimonas sp. SYP-B2681]